MRSRVPLGIIIVLASLNYALAEAPRMSFPVSELMVAGGVFDDDLAEAKGPTIVGREAVVVSGNVHATMVAYDIIRQGGNAFDAGVAGAAALKLTKYHHAGWVGITPFIGFSADEGVVAAYAGVGNIPAAAELAYYQGKGYTTMPNDWRESALLGTDPDTFVAILQRWGTMSFTEVMQGALELAENGFPAYIFHMNYARNLSPDLLLAADDQYTLDYWLPQGRPPEFGEPIVNADLANSFRLMMDAEQQALARGASRHDALEAARDAFYKGEIAEKIAAHFEKHGGLITYEDLANYRGVWYEQDRIPSTTFMGLEVFGAPEWTQCGTFIQVLNILENFDLKAMGWNTPDYIHVITQAFNLAMADRWQYYGDPDFVDIPQNLYSKEYGRIRAELIDMNQAFQVMPPPGDPVNMQPLLAADLIVPHPVHGPILEHAGVQSDQPVVNVETEEFLEAVIGTTTYIGVIDKDGNIFSMTPSDPIAGAHALIPGLGFGFWHRGNQFTNHDPNHSHVVAPGKRPMVTPNPALGLKDGEGLFAIGTPGGDQQPQAQVQVFLNRYMWGMAEQMAVDQPRFGTFNFYGQFSPYPYSPGLMRLEDAFSAEVEQGLIAKGHTVGRWDAGVAPTTWRTGSVGFVTYDAETGLIFGGADARRESFGVGW